MSTEAPHSRFTDDPPLLPASPEPGGVLDRDQARDVLLDVFLLDDFGDAAQEAALDRLDVAVRPAAIDRDALVTALGSFAGEAFGSGNLDYTAWADWIIAKCVRPVAGVTLTPEEVAQFARVLAALRRPGGISIADLPAPADLDRLANRLEAAS